MAQLEILILFFISLMSRGIVLAVLSGDTLAVKVIGNRETSIQAISLDFIQAPRLGNYDGRQKDEPYAYEAFEFVRKLSLGQRVMINNAHKAPNTKSNPIFGPIPLSYAQIELFDQNHKDLGMAIIEEGLANLRIRQLNQKQKDNADPAIEEYKAALTEAFEAAKEAKKGIFSEKPSLIRPLPVDYQPQQLLKKKKFNAITESIINGSTFNVFLLPTFELIKLQLAGVRTPSARRDAPEPFGPEAKQFCESRILQRNVEVELLQYSEQTSTFLGRLIHPKGDISVFLLDEGLGQMNNQTAALIPNSGELRQAETRAKESRKNLWKNFDTKSLLTVRVDGRVTFIKGSSSIEVDTGVTGIRRLWLSNCRIPQFNPSGVIEPFGLEAHELLRTLLIGRQVQCMVDYTVEERQFATVYVGNTCINESLAAAGLCTVFVAKNQNPSERIDSMMQAEQKAKAKKLGIHTFATPEAAKAAQKGSQLNDLSNKHSRQRSVPFMHFIEKRVNKGVVEYFASATRLVILIPSQRCIIRVNLQGLLACDPNERLGHEALEYCNMNYLQRDVEVQVFDIDKMGVFIGNVRICTPNGKSVSLEAEILSHGFTEIHSGSVSKCPYRKELDEAQAKAESQKIGVWATGKTSSNVLQKGQSYEVQIVNVYSPITLSVQIQSQALYNINEGFKAPPKPAGKVMKGDLVAAIWEGKIYRTKILTINEEEKMVHLDFFDLGIEDDIPIADLRALPQQLVSIPPQALTVGLAGVRPFKMDDEFTDTVCEFINSFQDSNLYAHLVFEDGMPYVILTDRPEPSSESLNSQLLQRGYVGTYLFEVDPPFDKVFEQFEQDEKAAREDKKGAWVHGNISLEGDDEGEY